MKKSRLTGTLCTCLAIFPLYAGAIIVDKGTYLTDTATGWDWLDLSVTAGMSYDQVMAEMGPGGMFEGWTYATRTDLATLWDAFGGDSSHYMGWSTENNGLFDAIAPLQGDLFCEHDGCLEGQGFSHWITADIATAADVAADIHSPHTVVEGQRVVASMFDLWYWAEPAYEDYVQLTQLTMLDSKGDIEVGSALYRAAVVPVPAAVWLFGSGLLGLVGVARRKQAA